MAQITDANVRALIAAVKGDVDASQTLAAILDAFTDVLDGVDSSEIGAITGLSADRCQGIAAMSLMIAKVQIEG